MSTFLLQHQNNIGLPFHLLASEIRKHRQESREEHAESLGSRGREMADGMNQWLCSFMRVWPFIRCRL